MDVDQSVAALVPFVEHGSPAAVLLRPPAGASVWRNGYPPLGVAVLEDRDELLIDGERVVLGTREAAVVSRFDPAGNASEPPGARCPRCNGALETGDAVVRCPACGRAHHEEARREEEEGALACWSYAEFCAACQVRRDELLWHPEGVDEGDDA